MTNRVVMGGTFKVSKPGVNVLTASPDDLVLDDEALAYVTSLVSGSASLSVTYTRDTQYASSLYYYTATQVTGSYIYYNPDNSFLGVVPHIIYSGYKNPSSGTRTYQPYGPTLMYDRFSGKSGTVTFFGRPIHCESDRQRFRFIVDAHKEITEDVGTSFTRTYTMLYNVLAVGGEV